MVDMWPLLLPVKYFFVVKNKIKKKNLRFKSHIIDNLNNINKKNITITSKIKKNITKKKTT